MDTYKVHIMGAVDGGDLGFILVEAEGLDDAKEKALTVAQEMLMLEEVQVYAAILFETKTSQSCSRNRLICDNRIIDWARKQCELFPGSSAQMNGFVKVLKEYYSTTMPQS
jgi:hypothetical protein